MVAAIGKRIREERRCVGLNQAEAAKGLGVGNSFLCDVEKGRTAPTVDLLEAVCSWRSQSLDWLLFGEDADAEASAIVAEGRGGYGPPPTGSLAVVGGGRRLLPADLHIHEVKGDDLLPVARTGEFLLVTAAKKGDDGPGIVSLHRRRWRIVGKLY